MTMGGALNAALYLARRQMRDEQRGFWANLWFAYLMLRAGWIICRDRPPGPYGRWLLRRGVYYAWRGW